MTSKKFVMTMTRRDARSAGRVTMMKRSPSGHIVAPLPGVAPHDRRGEQNLRRSEACRTRVHGHGKKLIAMAKHELPAVLRPPRFGSTIE
jgi:hypothetical protein